jgi:hypothetical protein
VFLAPIHLEPATGKRRSISLKAYSLPDFFEGLTATLGTTPGDFFLGVWNLDKSVEYRSVLRLGQITAEHFTVRGSSTFTRIMENSS